MKEKGTHGSETKGLVRPTAACGEDTAPLVQVLSILNRHHSGMAPENVIRESSVFW